MDLFDHKFYVGVVGSRRRDEQSDYRIVLDAFLRLLQFSGRRVDDLSVVIVSGGCSLGGDRFAEIIAREYRMQMIIHKPDRDAFPNTPDRWRSTKQNYARNELVARDSRDALIACVAPDRRGGTEDTIRRWVRIHRGEPILC